jgi:uncharacterized protein (DUF58 family)
MLTTRGLAALVILALVYIIADLINMRVLYLLSVALGLALVLGYAQVRRAPQHVRSSRFLGHNPCLEGESVKVESKVIFGGRVPGVVISAADIMPFGLNRREPVETSSLVPGQITRSYRIRPEKRGRYKVGPMVVGVADSFGLMVRSFSVGEESPLMVYPKHLPIQLVRGNEASEMLGVSTTNEKGASAEFLRIRLYQPGDEMKTIHWRSSAKTGKLMVRELAREETRSTTIILNCEERSNRGMTESFELGVKVAASIAVSALKQNIDVRMILHGEDPIVVAKGRGMVQYHRLLSALATVKPHGKTPLDTLLLGLEGEQITGGTLHIVSTTITQRDLNSASRLTRRGIIPSLILVGESIDPDAQTLAAARRISVFGGRLGVVEKGEMDSVVLSWAH